MGLIGRYVHVVKNPDGSIAEIREIDPKVPRWIPAPDDDPLYVRMRPEHRKPGSIMIPNPAIRERMRKKKTTAQDE